MPPLRLCVWSGPRNLSTALLRAFGGRSDTFVSDEPLYAAYLAATGKAHPGRDEILARCETDPRKVIAHLTGPVPGRRPVWYQKHMAHHLLPDMERSWLDGMTHAFLVRDPAAMLVSLHRVFPDPTLEDTGLPQQVEIFRRTADRLGRAPPVLDADDLLADPRHALSVLCARIGLPFEESMLRWEPGPRETDGVWGRWWYASVWRSTGFARRRSERPSLPARLVPLLDACRPLYDALHRHRLAPPEGS